MINIYETVYKLSADPFRLSPDHRFSYGHPSYARAKAYLEYALLQGEGFVMITGAPGTGKTTLVREILANIDIVSVEVATLTSTQLRTRDLLQMVATAFGLRFQDADKASLLTALEQSLQQQYKSGRRAVLIVDEAQGLSINALEELRLLANLQGDNQMLLQVFLLGQEKLRDLINSPGMEQLRQRVVASSHIEPLNLDDTVNYVEHRLSQAGWQGDPEIDGDALQLIYRYSRGVPRRVNLICTRLLLSGGLRGRHTFDRQHAQDVILELQKEMLIDPDVAEVPEEKTGPVPHDDFSEENSLNIEQTSEGLPKRIDAEPDKGVTSRPIPASSASPDDLRENKAPPPDSERKKSSKKKTEDPKHVRSLSKDSVNAAELENSKRGQAGEGRPPISLASKKGSAEISQTSRPLTARKGSIASATAQAAQISRKSKPAGNPVIAQPERDVPEKLAAKAPTPGNLRHPVENIKRKGMSLRIQLGILLLVLGPPTAVVGLIFQDQVITVSALADAKGVIRRVVSNIRGPIELAAGSVQDRNAID